MSDSRLQAKATKILHRNNAQEILQALATLEEHREPCISLYAEPSKKLKHGPALGHYQPQPGLLRGPHRRLVGTIDLYQYSVG